MNVLELRLEKVLNKSHADFVDSLKLNGIDVERGIWTASAVEHNAQVGAAALMFFASQECIPYPYRSAFLHTIVENLEEESCFTVMAWLYAAYEQFGRFPPLAIVQHMINPALFNEYCCFLRKWLFRYISEGLPAVH